MRTTLRNAVGVLVAVAGLIGCGAPESQEVRRLTSPDGVVDVVVTSKDVNATVATPFELYIVKRGESWDKQAPILKGDKFEGLDTAWRKPGLLEISFQQGRVFSFTNFWSSASVQDWKYNVHIRLIDAGQATAPKS